MTQRHPLVSIITPAYNRAAYLEETIESVLSQDFQNFEYIVLDDGSTDNTKEVLNKYSARLICEAHSNMGETRTVNKGFTMAKGEIICVVNSDDPLLPGAISTAVEAMQSNPELLVVYPDWETVDQSGNLIEHTGNFDYDYINMVRWFHCIPGPGSFFKRSIATQLNGRDPQFRFVGDFDFWIRAGLYGPFAHIRKPLVMFRVHVDSATVNMKGKLMAEEHIRLVKKLYRINGLPKEVLNVRREAFSNAYYIAGMVCGNHPFWKKLYFTVSLAYSTTQHRCGDHRRRNRMLKEIFYPISNLFQSK
jgi:glycosyltransferase involved in cell wall biosynthesis